MNGSAVPLPGLGAVQVGNPEVISLLEQTLAAARSGNVHAVAIVTVHGPGRSGMAWAGGCQADVNLGLDALKGAVLASTQPGKQSPIVRAR